MMQHPWNKGFTVQPEAKDLNSVFGEIREKVNFERYKLILHDLMYVAFQRFSHFYLRRFLFEHIV